MILSAELTRQLQLNRQAVFSSHRYCLMAFSSPLPALRQVECQSFPPQFGLAPFKGAFVFYRGFGSSDSRRSILVAKETLPGGVHLLQLRRKNAIIEISPSAGFSLLPPPGMPNRGSPTRRALLPGVIAFRRICAAGFLARVGFFFCALLRANSQKPAGLR